MTGDVVNQLADRAVFLQRNGQSEVRMDLKPEYLGRIQMKVATENHRVTVHLLAETPMAREIIEANLGQLRSDLANQGLNVDQIEVAMFASGDRDSQGAGNPNQGGEGRMPGGAMKTAAVEGTQEAPSGISEQAAGSGNRSVDYFA
jgi:flagellar hook-length control protein FliK